MRTKSQTKAAFTPQEHRGFSRAFWATLLVLLMLVGSLELYVFLKLGEVTESLHSTATSGDAVGGSAGGRRPGGQLDLNARGEGELHWRSKLIIASFESARQEYEVLHERIESETRGELAETRRALIAQVPAWADWYYSVIGEYIRLGHLGAHAIGQSDFNEYLIDQLTERVFKPARVSERLSQINERRRETLNEQHKEVLAHLSAVLKHHSAAATGWSDTEQAHLKDRLRSLERLEHVATLSPIGLAAKLTTLTGVKLGLKALAARSAVKLGSVGVAKGAAAAGIKAGGKLGVKAGVRGGSVVASGASATLACAPLGLAAPVCGVAAGVTAWFAVDKAIVLADEYFNRDEFILQLKAELDSVMDEIDRQVLTGLDEHHEQILETLWNAKHETRSTLAKGQTRLIDHIQAPPQSKEEPSAEPNTEPNTKPGESNAQSNAQLDAQPDAQPDEQPSVGSSAERSSAERPSTRSASSPPTETPTQSE